MFSDIAGYTAIMGRDEESAIRALDVHRETLRTVLPQFGGRLIGEVGDGTLSSFHSAIDAVNCARRVQELAEGAPELKLRIAIHLGDVVFTNNTVVGDGVNVASRIHALAPPGGICISASVYDEVRNKPGLVARDLGERRLKNVSRPIRVYAVALQGSSTDRFAERTHAWKPSAATLTAIGTLMVAAVIYGVVVERGSFDPGPMRRSVAPRTIRSIAVLPLDNFSGDPKQEYFADGMTDELTTDLATISGLRVISRSSVMRYKGEHRPPTPEIAKVLNVDAVVEGSVMRVGDRVRITAQLIDAPNDQHLWAKSFERDSRDVLALQDELASAIAKEINVRLTPDEQARLTSARVVNPEAHDAYLKGRYFFNRPSDENLKKAIAQFEEAIRLDPNFAPAYAGLSDAYLFAGFNEGVFTSAEAMPKTRAAAERAVQLDDSLADAHTSLGMLKAFYLYDWRGSESEFRRAIELNPSYALAHDQFGLALALQGRLNEALEENKRAVELDPLSGISATDMAFTLTFQGKFEAAKELVRKTAELDPTIFMNSFTLGWIEIQTGKFREATTELQKAKALKSPPVVSGWLGYAYGASGDHAHAMEEIQELKNRPVHGYVPPFNLAIVYLGMGDHERALEGLEGAYSAHSQGMLWLKMDRIFDPLRTEPRFIELMKKLNFEK